MMFSFGVIICIVLSYSDYLYAETNNEIILRRNIFKDYNPRIRPVLQQNDTVTVIYGMSLHQIIDLNEKNQILVSNMWIRQVWYNPLIVWEPDKNGNITKINVSPRLLWKPDLVLYNNANDNSDGALNKFDTDIVVEFNGKNTWLAPVIFKSTCKINVAYFPFDEQNCTLKIGSWTSDGLRLDLRPAGDEEENDHFVSNGEWDLIEFKAQRNVKYYICCKEPYPDVTFRLQIRRRSLFYYMNLLIPCFLLAGVNFLSFTLPPDSGERITLVVTSLLTMTVFMLLVAELMPPVSDVVPIISIYYVTAMFVVALSMAATCLVLRCYFRTADRMSMPLPVRFLVFQVLARIVRFKSSSKTSPGKGSVNTTYTTSHPPSTCASLQRKTANDPRLLKSLPQTRQEDVIERNLSSIANILEDKMKSEKKSEEWQEAAVIIDKFFFWLFIVVTAAGTMVVFLQAPKAQQHYLQ